MSSSYTHPYSYASTSELHETLPSPQAESEILNTQEDMWFDSEDPAEYAMAATYSSFNLTDVENDQLGDSGSPLDLPVSVDVQMEEGFREMEQYINYDEDPDTPVNPILRAVHPLDGRCHTALLLLSTEVHSNRAYGLDPRLPYPAFYTAVSISPLAPSAHIALCALSSPCVPITTSSSNVSISTTLEPKLSFGGNKSLKIID
ncbi:hypothetical protein JR316_0013404 [Psilocybe cubensis]|uniref:Uncharacterized protein n=1 Tax=Psilocybe cubensis TaxID=181762 RepID=A0ACB8GFB9_PSICU|nr:uncharacterized protein JR316_0013404 [Psilocybe cubensis]KAH9474241.1 hypothetical protein JR316_0013404 [Psilocybe cubensis]